MRWCTSLLAVSALLACGLTAVPSSKAQSVNAANRIAVQGYAIDAEIDPAAHHLAATVRVTFTAPGTADTVTFGFHPALKLSKVTDDAGTVLTGDRSADGGIRITPAVPFVKGQPVHWTFVYDGTITGKEDGPEEGLKLAAIEEPITYLLYPARWFPMTGYMTDRFTAEMHIRVPRGIRVIASGSQGEPKAAKMADGRDADEYSFNWTKPGFPGTVIAGRFLAPTTVSAGGAAIHVYLTEKHQAALSSLGETAGKEFEFFTDTFGAAEAGQLNVVELPDDTLPSVWAPELAAIPGLRIEDKSGIRLLANTIAHQWWGSEVSPATLNDAWITNGMSRYGELMYVEEEGGKTALKSAILDVSAGALAYDTTPLSSVARLSAFSPQFQSMTLEKGAMVFHMLRWELGDAAFKKVLQGALSQYTDQGMQSSDFEKVAEAVSQQQLMPFFAQWVDGTGAPQFGKKYAVYRLGNNKGFRTIGEIQQDLDLFRMPVELEVETDGRTETKKVDVVGPDSQFVIDTFGRPRRIAIDPDGWLLKSSPDLEVRVEILKGQQLVAQGDLTGALDQYQKALETNAQSSLVSYRIGEVLFTQKNFQAAANAYRDALRGDGDPKWTEVWSHVALGKIFDLTGQRDRAVNEYRQAVQTNDNTQGAVNEARLLLQKPYQKPENQ